MSDTYCHYCDADPCYGGPHGSAAFVKKTTAERSGPKGLDAAVREFVLSSYEAGVHDTWTGWQHRIREQFGEDDAPRQVWNRVSNTLQRDWLLIGHPNREASLMAPSFYPEVRRLSVEDATSEVEQLIDSGGWTAEDKGLRLWQVVWRVPNAVYISTYDALHDMNRRGHRVTTQSPRGKNSQFWYVKS